MHLRVTILPGEEENRSASLQGRSLRKINMPFDPIIYPIWCSEEVLWQEAADSPNCHTHDESNMEKNQTTCVCVLSDRRSAPAPLIADACWDTAGNTIRGGQLVRRDCRLIALSHRRRTSVWRSSSEHDACWVNVCLTWGRRRCLESGSAARRTR